MADKLNPLVSIIIPSFNRESLISETLDSVKKQIYKNWECIVVDDGSIDGTVELIEEFVKKDARFKLFKRDREPKGANTCRNIGFKYTKGIYINWFDSDDIMLPNFISSKVSKLEGNLNIEMVVCKGINFSTNPYHEFQRKYILKSNSLFCDYMESKIKFFTGGPLFRKSFLQAQPKLFNEGQLKHQETEFFFRLLLSINSNYGTINNSLFKIRTHDNNITSKVQWQQDVIITSKVRLNRYRLLKKKDLLSKRELEYFKKKIFEDINNYFQLKYYGLHNSIALNDSIYILKLINSELFESKSIMLMIESTMINFEIIKGSLKLILKKVINYK